MRKFNGLHSFAATRRIDCRDNGYTRVMLNNIMMISRSGAGRVQVELAVSVGVLVITTCRRRASGFSHSRPPKPSQALSTFPTSTPLSMPSEFSASIDEQPYPDNQQSQVKLCSRCQRPVDPTNSVFLPGAEAIVCASCQPSFSPINAQRRQVSARPFADIEATFSNLSSPGCPEDQVYQDTDMILATVPESDHDFFSVIQASSSSYPKPQSFSSHSDESTYTLHNSSNFPSHSSQPSIVHTRTLERSSRNPSPLTDITRLRVRSQGHHCLYPGAIFQGTQKSGRNSYDVNVTIVVRSPRLPYAFILCSVTR
jgi:hypothetical protein